MDVQEISNITVNFKCFAFNWPNLFICSTDLVQSIIPLDPISMCNWCLSFTAYTKHCKFYWHGFRLSKILPICSPLAASTWTSQLISGMGCCSSLSQCPSRFRGNIFYMNIDARVICFKNLWRLCSGPCSVFSSHSVIKPSHIMESKACVICDMAPHHLFDAIFQHHISFFNGLFLLFLRPASAYAEAPD